jgi:hypothetical protein
MITTTAITITESTVSKGWYDITTGKGKQLQVVFFYGKVFVKVLNASVRAYGNVSMGKRFDTIADAVEGYKNTDTKQALRALLSELV